MKDILVVDAEHQLLFADIQHELSNKLHITATAGPAEGLNELERRSNIPFGLIIINSVMPILQIQVAQLLVPALLWRRS